MMKKLFIILVIIAVSTYCYLSYRAWVSNDYFKVIFFDVGQGDSSLIITPTGKTILTDGGPDNKVLRELGKELPFWVRHLDAVVLTHAHDDHLLGLIEVCRRYQIKQILYNNLDFNTPALTALTNTLRAEKIKLTVVYPGMVFNFGDNCQLQILAASKEQGIDENDYSIVSSFNCLDRKVLFTGDAGLKIEESLLNKKIDLKADILKISHHGSKTANSINFLQAVNPKLALISLGLNNKYKHPDSNIIERLKKIAVDIYRTDLSGSLVILANNKEISIIH